MARLPNGVFIAFPGDDDQTPTIKAQIMCEETMEATQGAMLTHTASYLLKLQARYALIPKWKVITRHNAWTELRGAIKLANHIADVELMA